MTLTAICHGRPLADNQRFPAQVTSRAGEHTKYLTNQSLHLSKALLESKDKKRRTTKDNSDPIIAPFCTLIWLSKSIQELAKRTPCSMSEPTPDVSKCSIRLLAEKNPQHILNLTKKKFKPAVTVCDTMTEDPSRSRKVLSTVGSRGFRRRMIHRMLWLKSPKKQGQITASIEANKAA